MYGKVGAKGLRKALYSRLPNHRLISHWNILMILSE